MNNHTAEDIKRLESYIKAYIEKQGYPGVAVGIRGPEGPIFEKGFGHRSIRRNTPVDTDTVFGIASLSKSFTALACCMLHVEGKLSLDDPVTRYFPDFSIPGLPDEAVTLKLMGLHRAGLPPMEVLEWSCVMNSVKPDTATNRYLIETAPNKMETIEQIIEYIARCPHGALGSPGEYMSYSNEGYAIMSYIVDQAAGVSLEEFLNERIFRPLGMTRSILDVDTTEARALIADDNITSLFSNDETGELVEDDDWTILPPYRGCAMIKSTVADIGKYYQMLSQRGKFEGQEVVSEEAIELLVGPEYPLRAEPYFCQGLRKYRIGGHTVCDHGGEMHGVSAFGGFLDSGYSVAVLCNASELDMEGLQWICYNYLLDLPLETEHHWAVPSGDVFSRPDMICGEYVAHEGESVYLSVRIDGDELRCYYQDEEVGIRYCHSTVFALYDPATGARVKTLRFHIRDGMAWAVNFGSRVFQRA